MGDKERDCPFHECRTLQGVVMGYSMASPIPLNRKNSENGGVFVAVATLRLGVSYKRHIVYPASVDPAEIGKVA
jgi:hypothetical protein